MLWISEVKNTSVPSTFTSSAIILIVADELCYHPAMFLCIISYSYY